MMDFETRRPIQPIGPAVDPWVGRPLFPEWEGYSGYIVLDPKPPVPAIPGPDVPRRKRGRHAAR